MAKYIDCSAGSTPFTYLGLPIGTPSNKASSWQPIIDKFDKRLSEWKAKSISFGGRLILIKSILSSTTIWNEIIKAGKIADNLGANFSNSITKCLGNGNNTKFWLEKWCGSETFSSQFRRLFMLDSNKNALVSERLSSSNSHTSGTWNWVREPYGRSLNELSELNNLLSSINLSENPDTWKWNLDNSGVFTTKSLSSILDNLKLEIPTSSFKTPRNKLIPQKINIFIWRVILGRIPTRVELDKRNIDLDTILCPQCNSLVETIEHTLYQCTTFEAIWNLNLAWWNLPTTTFSSLFDITLTDQTFTTSPLGKFIWQATKWTTIYMIWKNRNAKVFSKKDWCPATILSEIQAQTFSWISKISKKSSIDWHQWCRNPS
ncbi:uncharacterized protein [Rutidosis leptorrhynchoides]|uniref:uncharacterized protein n=1 Tax=Rutidosis leptorrhynchoides TaxID=125765 RepID=UPI003A99E4EE